MPTAWLGNILDLCCFDCSRPTGTMDSSIDLDSSVRSSEGASPRAAPSPVDLLQQCASMGVLMRFKHTAELLALGPRETTRALVEIQQGAVLNRFYVAAEDMGLRRERVHMIRTTDELDAILEKVRWALRTVQWNAKRLANICRWILRSIRTLQRFARRYLPRLRRMKASVLRIWTDAMSKASANLQRQTMEHIRRYRITLQHESFRDEALGLLLDCHVASDEVLAAVESLWRFRRDEYRSMFRRRQRESRVRQTHQVSVLQSSAAQPKSPVEAPRQPHERRASVMATKTLTFRTLRLKRIDFEVPGLAFGPENVSLAEICVHHRILKLRQVQDNIAAYQPSQYNESADTSAMSRVLATALRVDPFTAHERAMRTSMLDVARRSKVPVTYLHALLSIDSSTQWFLLYLIRQLQKGGTSVAQGQHLPDVMQGHWDTAVHITSKWGPGTTLNKQPSVDDRRRPATADPRRRQSLSTGVAPPPRPASAKGRDQEQSVAAPQVLGGVPRVCIVRRVSPTRTSPTRNLRIIMETVSASPASLAQDGATSTSPMPHGTSALGGSVVSPRGSEWARAVSPYSHHRESPADAADYSRGDADHSTSMAGSFWTDVLAHHNDGVAKARTQFKQRAAALAAKVSPRGANAVRPVSPPTPRELQHAPRMQWQPPVKPLYRPTPTHTKPPAMPTLESILTSRRLTVEPLIVAAPPTSLRPKSAPTSRGRRV